MSICWYCHWGWPATVRHIYKKAAEELKVIGSGTEPLNYGPGHVVWDDENFDSAEWCIEHFSEFDHDLSAAEREIVMRSLVELAKVPKEFRCTEPEDYDGEHPQVYPPGGAHYARWK